MHSFYIALTFYVHQSHIINTSIDSPDFVTQFLLLNKYSVKYNYRSKYSHQHKSLGSHQTATASCTNAVRPPKCGII